MATKIFKTKRVIYRVEKNENGTLNIYREYFSLKNMDHWEKDGRPFQNAGSLIITAGGIEGLLNQCEDVEDIEAMIAELNAVKAEIRRKANAERERQASERQNIAETEYHQLFDGKDVVETNAKTVYALPMDDCDALVLLDFGGRTDFRWMVTYDRESVGGIPTEMFQHFFQALCSGARCNLHIEARGENAHHKTEAIFKAFARSVRMAVAQISFPYEIPSSKGVL